MDTLAERTIDIMTKRQKVSYKISDEDMEIVTNLEQTRRDLIDVHENFDNATEPSLVDSFIYEILALNMKYKYYHQLCKERGIAAEGVGIARAITLGTRT